MNAFFFLSSEIVDRLSDSITRLRRQQKEEIKSLFAPAEKPI